MIEDAWNDFKKTLTTDKIFNEDVSGLQLITIRVDGNRLYKDLHNGGYVVCSQEMKNKIKNN